MLTSVSDVYACGDCVEVEDLLTHKPKLSLKWYDARLQAMVAASNCAGKYREYPGSYEVAFFGTFGVDALSLGSTEAVLQARGVNDLEIIEHTSYKHHQHFIIKDAKILGAQLIGHPLDERPPSEHAIPGISGLLPGAPGSGYRGSGNTGTACLETSHE